MDTFRLCGAAVCALLLITVVKQTKTEFSPLISLAACILLAAAALSSIAPAAQYVGELLEGSGQSEHLGILFRALAVAMMTGGTAEMCRDAGESALASKVELLGKAEILLLSTPLIKELAELAGTVING